MSQPDIRKWFMKTHDNKNNANAVEPVAAPVTSQPEDGGGQESSGRRKTSKYFAADAQKPKDDDKETPAKRKTQIRSEELEEDDVKPPPAKKIHKVKNEDNDGDDVKPLPAKKIHKVKNEDDDDNGDDDFVLPKATKKSSVEVTPTKKLKNASGKGVVQKSVDTEKDDDDDPDDDEVGRTPVKAAGRGRGARGGRGGRGSAAAAPAAGRGSAAAAPAAGRGRGGGRGGFMNFGERKDPPHKGEKEVPEGASDCLSGKTFVISGTLDSLEREEAEDLIKRHGGRVTGSISKKTSYLLADEDIGGKKSEKAKELGTPFLTEDRLFDLIRKSKPTKTVDKVVATPPKGIPLKVKEEEIASSSVKKTTPKSSALGLSPAKRKAQSTEHSSLTWPEKYKPKVPNDILGNTGIVKQLHDWLVQWNDQFLNTSQSGKSKKQNDSQAKKAVLLSGSPGIGKTTSAKLVSQMLGFQAVEVNASDSRGKAKANINEGIGGSTANSVKELISNEALHFKVNRSKPTKTVLIMDEVDGMSTGDRGGTADLIASIKISKIPIICICNDRQSQKLKSLVNHCLLLNFRKPTKQQMGKRLMQVAIAEGIQVNEIALEELAERVNGDMRLALNQLQYMSLLNTNIKYDDVRQRLLSSAKDVHISAFTAVDKLFGFNGSKLRMDERIDFSMSDPDLVPLIVQENYLNFRPSSVVKDENGIKRMNMIARAAESIGNGDIINVQIRRYRQWQLSPACSLASSIIPAALLHGSREIFQQGEHNYNRFGGWLGKNSTTGKNLRLLEDLHVHLLSSRESNLNRDTLRVDYSTLMVKQLTDPLRQLPKDEAVQKVVEFMDTYSLSQEDFDTIMELSKFQKHPSPLDGIQPAVKAALTKAYKQGSSSRIVRAADMVTLPGIKKAPKKRIAAMLEPVDDSLTGENGEAPAASEEENASDTEDRGGDDDVEKKPQLLLQSSSSKGIQVQLDLKNKGNSSVKKTPASRSKAGSAAAGKKGGRTPATAAKRKR